MTQSIGFEQLAERLVYDDGAKGYRAKIPTSWMQGRTAYGGLTTGLAMRAVMRAFDDLAPLRSVMVSFLGPVTEEPVFIPHLLRRGRSVTHISVDVVCDGQIGARIALVFGAGRDSEIEVTSQGTGAIATPKACEPFTPPQAEGFVPAFFLRFDTRLIDGARPVTGADTGYIHCWSRHKDERSRGDLSSLLAIGDVLPPAALSMAKRLAPVSSVTWMFNLLTDDPQTKDGWWRVDTRISSAQNGYSSQIMNVWNTDGELVAQGQQSVAIFL